MARLQHRAERMLRAQRLPEHTGALLPYSGRLLQLDFGALQGEDLALEQLHAAHARAIVEWPLRRVELDLRSRRFDLEDELRDGKLARGDGLDGVARMLVQYVLLADEEGQQARMGVREGVEGGSGSNRSPCLHMQSAALVHIGGDQIGELLALRRCKGEL